jgi:hypothetical protein
VEPDLDDTLPGRNSGGILSENDSAVPDIDDTIISAAASLGATTATTATDETTQSQLADTGPLDSALEGLRQPTQYGVRLHPTGDIIPLDSTVFFGRRPSTPRISNGELPTLVRVDSPVQEVSGTHLEVRQIGSSVVVTDLKSTNGSRVSVPGRESRTLRGGDAMVVSPGTRVDIGDGNVLEILSLTRLHHQEG